VLDDGNSVGLDNVVDNDDDDDVGDSKSS